jgi:hypothetical protein
MGDANLHWVGRFPCCGPEAPQGALLENMGGSGEASRMGRGGGWRHEGRNGLSLRGGCNAPDEAIVPIGDGVPPEIASVATLLRNDASSRVAIPSGSCRQVFAYLPEIASVATLPRNDSPFPEFAAMPLLIRATQA